MRPEQDLVGGLAELFDSGAVAIDGQEGSALADGPNISPVVVASPADPTAQIVKPLLQHRPVAIIKATTAIIVHTPIHGADSIEFATGPRGLATIQTAIGNTAVDTILQEPNPLAGTSRGAPPERVAVPSPSRPSHRRRSRLCQRDPAQAGYRCQNQ